MTNRSASFVSVTPEFGFNKYDLSHWQFTPDDVCVTFIGGKVEILTGDARENFRNWVRETAADAPLTHQPTLFGAMREG